MSKIGFRIEKGGLSKYKYTEKLPESIKGEFLDVLSKLPESEKDIMVKIIDFLSKDSRLNNITHCYNKDCIESKINHYLNHYFTFLVLKDQFGKEVSLKDMMSYYYITKVLLIYDSLKEGNSNGDMLPKVQKIIKENYYKVIG